MQPFHALLVLCLLLGGLAEAAAQDLAKADVVVVVDTSTSMSEPGMDPERTSLLVTKLLADIVPGELAVIRLLGILADQDLLPRRATGETGPCPEDPSQQCGIVARASDWEADAREKRYGALIRPSRADPDYKQALETHLRQRIPNSMFALSFRAAQGVFDQHPDTGAPRTVIWLSDGRSEHEERVQQVVAELQADGVAVEAIVFGRGDTRLAREVGLEVERAASPAELMKAFAGAFRRIVQAPYEIDNRLDAAPEFTMKPHVEEAWVVVYGDDTLGRVTLTAPDGRQITADYAAERWAGAGAYKVAYLRRPEAGRWTVQAEGGGNVAYAVVQRSELVPVLVEPEQAAADVPVDLVVEVRAGATGEIIRDPELLRGAVLTATFQGRTLTLRDDGAGRYRARTTFPEPGRVTVTLHLESPLVDRTAEAVVEVGGIFRATEQTLEIDLGSLGIAAEACRPLVLKAEHRGRVPLELKSLRNPPSGHRLVVTTPAGELVPGDSSLPVAPADALQICLRTSDRVASSRAAGEPWLALALAGSDAPEHRVVIELHWQVQGLSFWQRWGWLILLVLALLLLAFVVLGFVLPRRFQGTLALTFVPEREELDEQSPQPIKQWKGVRIGFYRDARAYLHPDFRLSGRAQGALASLHAETGGARVEPGAGNSLFRETLDGDWESVPSPGRRARAGDVYRIGERGPYFRIAVRR